jgi:phage terminase large subunit-like protein
MYVAEEVGGKPALAETFIYAVKEGGYKYPNLAGATAEDVRDVQIEGESGILACAPEDFYPEFIPTLKKLIWPNGVVSHIYYGSEPSKCRGPQSDFIWMDEVAKWQFAEETVDNLLMGLRLGNDPRCILTSTPRPTKFLIDLERRTDKLGRKSCVVTRGNTYDNITNLAPVFISTIISKYEGTRLGRQELEGEFLSDNPDALWKREDIDNNRVTQMPRLAQIVVAIDPAAKSSKTSDDTGIIVAGKGYDGHGYVLEDCTIHGTPAEWGKTAIAAYNKHKANWIIGETNNGGEMIEHTLRTIDPNIPYKAVHASRGKEIRAEPISSLYQQNRIHHIGFFRELEDELCEWIPNSGMSSPNRLDSLVWALTVLNISTSSGPISLDMSKGYSFDSGLSVSRFKGF